MDFGSTRASEPEAQALKRESDRLKAEAFALRFPPQKLRRVPLVMKEIHHWEANTPIVIADPLVREKSHLDVEAGAAVVLTKV